MKLALVTAATLLAGLLIACNEGGGPSATPTASPATTATPLATATPAPSPTTATQTPVPNVCQPNPDPASADVLVIDQPSSGATVTSPVTVSGQINAFEAQFKIAIYAADGSVIEDVNARSAEGQVLAAFSEDVAFSVTEETPACIWVYDLSPRDGSIENVGQVPVLLQP
ncbi:MAG: Gmad2 immunoglobulin-like domain-containing protein [Chloroflexi bacterium]|nr:Gmad2 immunoglobulin-like domain-containing protein [Chloroflexota bacterium]